MKLSTAASALALVSTVGLSSARVKKYCAKIDPETADGAKGFFTTTYSSNNQAIYSLSLDMSDFTGEADSDDFASGNLAKCEIGDLSGKFGGLKGGDRYFSATHKDTLAPFTANFKATDELANMWSSVVFHCKDDATRLVCADLVEC
ncbi:hypothetical protein TrRE_jg8897 [Triparma retinervis]|uniref:Uncharacterized protein n=1 Tax=Triparma retinervis TaxID=2557542 RepID=A0A9W6ZBP4_9STRA|nr:hypothetical protein TrRE_jg8897 [Triparma retinervis]